MHIPADRLEKLRGELTAILQKVEALPALDAAEQPPPARPDALRADAQQPCLARQTLLAGAPHTCDGCIEVPGGAMPDSEAGAVRDSDTAAALNGNAGAVLDGAAAEAMLDTDAGAAPKSTYKEECR